jgi:hypothetical protein
LPAQKKRNINRNKNAIKDKKSSIKSYQNQIKDTEEQRDEWPKVPLILGAAKDSISDKDELAYKTMMSKQGSKMAKLILWLKNCIKEDDENRFILFSKVSNGSVKKLFMNEESKLTNHITVPALSPINRNYSSTIRD